MPNDRGQDDWFATYCVTSKTRETSVNWPPWQGSKTNPLASDLPTTVSGTPHDGIKLGCWRCGKLLIDEGHIHRIKDTSVWTNSGFDSANFIFDREREQYNEYKKCKFVPVRCSGCRKSVATLYETQFWDSDTGALMTDEMQPVPCLKVTTLRKPPGETSFEHHTVLLGEEGDREGRHRFADDPRDPRAQQTDAETGTSRSRRLRNAEGASRSNGAEIMVDCNVCYDECSSLKGIRCSNTHFTCNDCFGKYVSSVCDDALSKGCLDVKCADAGLCFVFEHHDVCQHGWIQRHTTSLTRAGKRLREQKAIEEEKQRLEEELQRQQRMSEEERKINDARKTITEDILTLKCPRSSCKAAFVDFDGCFALSCESCPCQVLRRLPQSPRRQEGDECSPARRCMRGLPGELESMTDVFSAQKLQFKQIHKTRRSKLLKEFLERPDMRELAGKVVEALRKDLEDHKMHDILSSYGAGEHRPRPEVGIERTPRFDIVDDRDRYGRGSIVVEVELPGVGSAREVEAEFTDPTPLRSMLHIRVPGKYKADVRLPAKIDGDKPMEASFNSRRQRITFTLPVS